MKLTQATQIIRQSRQAMNQAFKRPLFDELCILREERGKTFLEWYEGPRESDFIARFHQDTAALKEEARSKHFLRYLVGDFEFTHEGDGTGYEAFIKLGQSAVLLCNNTRLSMKEISKDPLWMGAQVPFALLADSFRSDPLVLADAPSGPQL